MAGKYTPLEQYLKSLPPEQYDVTMSFEQIERIINDKLPASAYKYQAWWANEKNPHQPEKQAITNSGWKVDTLNLREKWVKFRRDNQVKEKEMGMVENHYRGTKEYALVYAELIAAAKYRGTVTYQEIAQILGLPLRGNYMQKEVGWLLGEISDDEVANGRPMLSAIAVGVSCNPGAGFFTLAKELGKLKDDDEQGFWESERQAVYETWKVELKKS